jgi:alanine racemase
MSRLGALPGQLPEFLDWLEGDDGQHVRLEGVMTHFACADDPDPTATEEAAARFDRAVAAIRDAGNAVTGPHLANTAATIRFPHLRRDRVRVGIAMYGLKPDPGMALPAPLRPVMTVHSRITRILELQPGDRVSYGGTWTAEEPSRVGLVAIGYADGYDRIGSNRAWMDVRGQRAPVRGRICMDQTMIGVPDDARPDDLVTVIGDGQGGAAPGIDQLAEMYDTIPHELATGLVVRRLAHLYVRGGRLVAITDLWGYRELDEDALHAGTDRELATAR